MGQSLGIEQGDLKAMEAKVATDLLEKAAKDEAKLM
jgi:hypothetical protein